MTELDLRIEEALASLGQSQDFDKAAYIAAFTNSAREKAYSVLDLLKAPEFPFRGGTPVFVSVGGGDGAELRTLLVGSQARIGILVEKTADLIQLAKEAAAIPEKSIEYYPGDAVRLIGAAMERARAVVKRGQADYVAVTCHAVIHELFDRSDEEFDPHSFFGKIFGDENAPSTWLTYREPGDPEKWPSRVLLKAACNTGSLLRLATAICERHDALAQLKPEAQVVGEHVLMHRTLAMETLAKLFYLDDLAYEIQERSTSVNHQNLMSTALMAIGRHAKEEGRGHVHSRSEPTKSFMRYWRKYQVDAEKASGDGTSAPLAIPESQTRVIAWRAARRRDVSASVAPIQADTGDSMTQELTLARRAFAARNESLLCSLLASCARSWIESQRAAEALEFVRAVQKDSDGKLSHLWSTYIDGISRLFAGERVPADIFSGRNARLANEAGLGVLFDAEYMEFQRKAGDFDKAIEKASFVIGRLPTDVERLSPEERYACGTASYLLANLMRHGGQYEQALPYIERAQRSFMKGISSHDTELAHCEYGKSICALMTGRVVAADFGVERPAGHQFASALVDLTYSHAAWFTDDIDVAKHFASDAQRKFSDIGFAHYGKRAQTLVDLLTAWDLLENDVPAVAEGNDIVRVVALVTSRDSDLAPLSHFTKTLKPSVVIGLLQFGRTFGSRWAEKVQLELPDMWVMDRDARIVRLSRAHATSMADADAILRDRLGIPVDRRVPLLAD